MTHLNDAALVRYADGEHEGPEATGWERHLASCDRCTEAVADVRAQSRLFSGWLERADFEADLPAADADVVPIARRRTRTAAAAPSRAGWTASPWLKAAAIALLMAAPVAAFPGVRGWIADRISAPAVETAAPVEAGSVEAGPVVRFAPAPGSFTVRIDAAAGATLILERADGGEAVLTLGADTEPVVAAGSVRIQATAGATHRLALPAAVSDVRVLVGHRTVAVTGADLDRGAVVDLSDR